MAKNLRALTDEELKYFVDNYRFELSGQYIVVYKVNYNLKTMHPIDEAFSIRSPLRRVTISLEAIDLWINKYINKYSLIEVQAAISRLIVTYQDLGDEEISKELLSSKLRLANVKANN